MEKNHLQEGISILYDMEKNNYLMTRAISKLDREIATLCKQRYIEPPKPKQLKESIIDRGFSFAFPFGVVGAIIGGILGLFSVFKQDFEVIIFAGIFILAVYIVIGAVIGFGVGLVTGGAIGSIKKGKEKEAAIKEYNIEKENYKRSLNNENIRIAQESKRRDILLYQKSKLIEKRNESKKLLASFYDIVGIDMKFRNLIPIGYMYDFMRLGIASEFGGVDGLYYLTRRDLREDQMNATLETIVNKLDIIIDNLNEIKYELEDINRKCDSILYETIKMCNSISRGNSVLNEIKNNTEVLAYYNERNNRELEYQNFMMTFHML